MKLLLLVIFFSGSQGVPALHASARVGPDQARVREGETGVLANDSGVPGQAWFKATVFREPCYTEDDVYPESGAVGESITLSCLLRANRLTPGNITWKKNCISEMGSSRELHFRSLTTGDAGNYTCTFINGTQGYSMSRTTELRVCERDVLLDPKIVEPEDNAEIKVDVGEPAMVSCIAVIHSDPSFVTLSWMEGTSLLEMDQSESVFYTESKEQQKDGKCHVNASLVFRRVSQEHLNTKYICKLGSTSKQLNNVSITLTQRGDSPSPLLPLGIVGMFAAIASLIMVIYLKLKIDIVLFLRELRGASFSDSDGKQYDAYIMYYKAASEEALTEEEKRLVPRILETEFGYRLCLYERDILPGRVVQEAVLEHIGQSRRLVLLPGTLEAEQESWGRGMAGEEPSLLSGLHAALVDRQTRLILVERAPRGELVSLPEPLQQLVRSGGVVAWRGERSVPLSSSFWKKLRYYMPPQKGPKHRTGSMTVL
ncbi:hypothetical protein SKAU_G00240030 [Synaphobranchus kaupii]|uniref:Uncharacterized protein n=1 Tax=Synaphobranchus kaupii TaxID=118154 RepID=A0A9Q1ITS9_SYNKA|nr:hypothetical protein SKAU_G00240030 [Synaphobranchus kaupii]